MMLLTQTDKSNYIRFIKNPKGPTITCKIDEYCLSKDVVAYQQMTKKNNKIFSVTLQSPPLLIMNGFGGRDDSDPYKIVSIMLQSMFPPIKVQAMNLSTCKRVVLFNLVKDPDSDEHFIEFRHYGISARQRAVNKSIKKVINHKKVPDMSRFNDLADFILHNKSSGAMSSDSEMDDIPESRITLPDDYLDKKGGSNVAIRLHELGPRLKLRLMKIEEGFCKGNVVFHSHIKKSKSEIKKDSDSLKNKRELKEKRKRVQEENVKRKLEKSNKKEKDQAKAEADEASAVKPKRVFENFQKDGKIVPNITSVTKRPSGISKGMWKQELKYQVSGEKVKKERRGMRSATAEKRGMTKLLGKREVAKTATTHKKNTSTFKTQVKKR